MGDAAKKEESVVATTALSGSQVSRRRFRVDESKAPGRDNTRRASRFSLRIDDEVIERLRNAVWWIPGLTLSGVANEALLRAVKRLEDENNSGKPFAKRGTELVGGRPIGK